jgi:hypothetical protein
MYFTGLQDTLNKASLAAVTDLQTGRWAGVETQKRALQVTMLTGDNEASARHFSQVHSRVRQCPHRDAASYDMLGSSAFIRLKDYTCQWVVITGAQV